MSGRAVRAGGGLVQRGKRSIVRTGLPSTFWRLTERADDETIFFPFSGDVHQMHSLLTLEGERRCLGYLSTCRFCCARQHLADINAAIKLTHEFSRVFDTCTWIE